MDFHNRRNTRQANHDYCQPCSYFITINIRFGQCLFGKALSPEEIDLNELGKIAQKFWFEIPEHFSHVQLGEFVIMPNHLHGIIHIGDRQSSYTPASYGTTQCDITSNGNVGSRHVVTDKSTIVNQFGPLPSGSLGIIISQYKSSVTRWANQNKFGGLFTWQSRFYDRILNDQESLMAAKYYIKQNPEKWWQKYKDQSW
jgi:REP element-mobilizing transposase RayT